MHLRCIIVDDEETGVETLKLLIKKHIGDVRIVAKTTKAKEAIGLIENYKPEIVFLDINMPGMNGFELLEKLIWKNFNLIFITAHQEHGLKALKLSAVDYLLKPVDHRDLRSAVDRIKNQLVQQNHMTGFDYSSLNSINQYYTGKLGINSKEGVEYLDPLEIVYLESKSYCTQIHLINGRTILTPKTLREFENNLCQNNINFMRVHHSYIINLNKILRYIKEGDDIIMTSNQKIPLSKKRKENFFKWLNLNLW